MSKASTKNYDSAVEKYNTLVNKYTGADNYADLYNQSAKVASKNAQQVQQDKYNAYLSQGMNPAKAARMASQDATENYTNEKNNLVNNLYNANKDTLAAQNVNIENAKADDDVQNKNKGRALATVGGVVSGVANAL